MGIKEFFSEKHLKNKALFIKNEQEFKIATHLLGKFGIYIFTAHKMNNHVDSLEESINKTIKKDYSIFSLVFYIDEKEGPISESSLRSKVFYRILHVTDKRRKSESDSYWLEYLKEILKDKNRFKDGCILRLKDLPGYEEAYKNEINNNIKKLKEI